LASCWAETIVIESKDLEVAVADEEGDNGIDRSATKGVVAEVNLDEVLLVNEGIAE
jgi:hypothetical protein